MRRLEVWCQAGDDGRLDLWLAFDSFKTAHSILDSRDVSGKGTFLMTTETDTLRIAKSVKSQRLYNRALRTSEAVGNFRACVLS